MAKMKSTKRALLFSGLVLVMCITMLIGSTFAWFTDSVTSSNNKIQAGTLRIDLESLENGSWTSIKDSSAPLFDYDLWEPGYTKSKVLKIENEGTLALKWFAKFISQKELSKLAEVIDVYVLPSATELAMPTDLNNYTKVGTLNEFVNTIEQTTYGTLNPMGEAGSVAYLGLTLKMQETAGNEYQGLDLGGEFDITILATQYTYEEDSFDNQYDADAKFDTVYTTKAVFNEGDSAVEAELRLDPKSKIGTVSIPRAALEEGETEAVPKIILDTPYSAVTVAADQEAVGYDISILGVKKDNIAPITIELRIAEGLDPATVKVYHKADEIDCSYNPANGIVTFQTTSFSPYTIVYDAESEFVAPEVDENKLPVAEVTDYTDIANIEWGKYGQWSPVAGLEANLETAYTFKCVESASDAALNPYANWNCDFYVSLDRDLGANQIFLGGNYGSFGWVGFHNGDRTVKANEEIGLLEGVTTAPWTYLDVASYVGEFICGVGDVDNALTGAKFTVKLRLTNPENKNEFYDIKTIEYTFK